MKPYPAYKPSGVPWLGEVPVSWSVLRVKEVASVLPSNIDKLTVDEEQAVLLCNYVDVYKNDNITADIEFMPATATDEQIRKLSLAKGDVVLTKDSESPWDIAVPTYIAEDIPNLVCGYHLAKLASDVNLMRGDFLFWAFKSFPVCVHFSLAASGITRYGLSIANISDGNIPVPSLSEQQAIAAYLDRETARIDTLIAEKGRLIDTLREYRQATISEVVTQGLDPAAPKKPSGVPWLGEVPAHWAIKSLRRVTDGLAMNGIFKKNDEFGDGAPLVNVTDLFSDNFFVDGSSLERVRCTEQELNQYQVCDGDLFLVRSSLKLDGIAMFAVARNIIEPTVFECHVVRLRPDSSLCNSRFMAFFLNSSYGRQSLIARSKSTTMTTIDQGEVLSTYIVSPPLDEQKAIAAYLDTETTRTDKLIEHVQDEIKLLHELRAATITDAVTGKIQVS